MTWITGFRRCRERVNLSPDEVMLRFVMGQRLFVAAPRGFTAVGAEYRLEAFRRMVVQRLLAFERDADNSDLVITHNSLRWKKTDGRMEFFGVSGDDDERFREVDWDGGTYV